MPTVAARELDDLVQRIFVAAGSPVETARTVAQSLVLANLKGVDSHGVVRVAEYVPLIDRGRIAFFPEPRQLVELALSLLTYAPGDRKVAAVRRPQATGAVGVCTAVGACGRTPLARMVILKVSRVSYLGCQSAVVFSFSVETTQG